MPTREPEFMGQQPEGTAGSAAEVARAAANLYTQLLTVRLPGYRGITEFTTEQAFELTCVIMKAEVDSL